MRRQLTFSSQEAVVEIEPTNDRTNIESAANGIELVIGSENLSACPDPVTMRVNDEWR
jgi:hypothetical protein